MTKKLALWMRFVWNLEALPKSSATMPRPYVIRPATRQDKDAVWKVVSDSLALDDSWNESFHGLRPVLSEQVSEAFDQREVHCLTLVHGTRIIGVSVLNPEPEAENHLLSGPCVFSEYRNRGLGTCLLGSSLEALRAVGLRQAAGITKRHSAAAKFVYPKFAGVGTPTELDSALAIPLSR